jgi:hypothetical protein
VTLQAPWHAPDAVSQFITQAVKAWVWGMIEGRPGGGGGVKVCCARRTGGPSSGVYVGAHTTPRIRTHTASFELTRTSLPHFSEATYRILHGAVYTLWHPKRMRRGWRGAEVKYNQSIGRHDGNRRRHNRTVKNCHVRDRRKLPKFTSDGGWLGPLEKLAANVRSCAARLAISCDRRGR